MSFRLLHTADLLLDVPFVGVGPTPRPLFERLRDAPLSTLDRLVDAAVAHEVDAVLLAGGLSSGGPLSSRASVRLTAALERLAGAGIPAIIALGPRETGGFPAAPGRDIGPAVTVVARGELEAVLVGHGGEPDVSVLVASAPLGARHVGRAGRALGTRPAVGMATLAPGPLPPLDDRAGLAFWALGGSPEPRGGPVGEGSWAVVAASPQPRVFPPPGPRPGAVLLEMGDDGPHVPVPLDLADVLLRSVVLDLAAITSLEELEERAIDGLGLSATETRPAIARLVVTGAGPARRELEDPSARGWLLDRLRARTGTVTPGWWSDVVLAPLPEAARTAISARVPGAAAISPRVAQALASPPGALLPRARQRAGIVEALPVPSAAAWPGLVQEAASLAFELVKPER